MIFGYNWDKDFQCNIRTLEAMLIRNPFRLELKKPHFHIISGFKKRYINASDDLGLHEDSMDIPGCVSQWDHCVIVARLQHLHQIGRDIIEDCVELFPTAKFGMCAVNDQIVSAVKTEFLKDNWLHFSNLITYFPGGFFNLIYWWVTELGILSWSWLMLAFLIYLTIDVYYTFAEATLRYGKRRARWEMMIKDLIDGYCWIVLLTFFILAVNASPVEATVPTPNASKVTQVSPGVLAIHRAQASVNAGHLIFHVNTEIDVVHDMEILDTLNKQYARICEKLENSDLPESYCYMRLQLVKQHTNKTACFISALFPTWNAQHISKRSVSIDLGASLAGHTIASLGSRARSNVPKFWPPNLVDHVLTEEEKREKALHAEQAANDQGLPSQANCALESLKYIRPSRGTRSDMPLKRERRSSGTGVITMLWRFLFGSGDNGSDIDAQKLAVAQYSTTLRMAALAHDVKRMAAQEALTIDSSNRVVDGVDGMAKGMQKFSINSLNVMMAEEYNHMMLLCLLMERKYELISSREHWSATFERLHVDVMPKVPEGTKFLDISSEKLMQLATFDNVLNRTVVYTTIQVPLVYTTQYEVLELFAVPNITTQRIITLPHRFTMINEM